MRYCKMQNDIKNPCTPNLGGVEKIYLLNEDEYIGLFYDTLATMNDAKFYEIDAMHNSARFVQTAVNGENGQVYVNNTLSFMVKGDAVNLEDSLDALLLGRYKVLVKYRSGYWRFVSDNELESFKQTSFSLDSGASESDANALAITMECNSHTFGMLFEEKPKFNEDDATKPLWVVIDERCEA